MKILVFSDPHIGLEGYGDPETALRNAVLQALSHHPDASLCVFLGDLVATGAQSEYAALKNTLDSISIDCRFVMGNHDNRAKFLSVFSDLRADESGCMQHACEVGDYHCLFLDTLAGVDGSGILCPQRMGWLNETLEKATMPSLIFMHHPPVLTHVPSCDRIGLKNRVEFETMVRRHAHRIEHILFGHCHFPVASSVAGIPALGLGSVLYQNLPNLKDNRFIAAPAKPGSYGVLVGKPGKTVALTEDVDQGWVLGFEKGEAEYGAN